MSGNLLLGIPSIDSEHQRFIDITNNLFAAMRDGKGNSFIGQTLDELAGYAKSHFTHEESLMQKAGFPGLAEHRRVHEECCRRIADIQDKFRSGSVLSQEVMSFLKSWLSDHIMGMDRNYVPAMKKNGIR